MNDIERYNRDKASVMSMIKFILIVAIFAAICFCATRLVVVLIPFLIGFLLAKTSYGIASAFTKNDKKKAHADKKRRRLAIVIYVILLVIVAILAVWACFSVFGQMMRAIDALTGIANNFDMQTWGNKIVDLFSSADLRFLTPKMITSIEDNITSLMGNLVTKLPSILSVILSTIWGFIGNIPYGVFLVICVILSGFYFINDGNKVMRFFVRNTPNRKFRAKTMSLMNDLSVTLFRALGGYILLLLITTFEAWATFRFAGVDYAFILAILTGLIDFMPVLGVSAVMVPVMIYCGFHGDYKAVIVMVIGMAVITVVRRLIEPPILGKTLHLHPLLMLVGMALGVYIWGAIGFLLGPTVLIIIIDIMHVFELDKKIMTFLSRVLTNFMRSESKSS